MKKFMLMQYFITAMVLTISIGLFTLKPVVNQQTTTQIASVNQQVTTQVSDVTTKQTNIAK